MAAVTGAKAASATLTSTTADTVTLTGAGKSLMVCNRDSSVTLWVAIDGATAVAAADECYPVLPLQTLVFDGSKFGGNQSISVVGNGNAYSVGVY